MPPVSSVPAGTPYVLLTFRPSEVRGQNAKSGVLRAGFVLVYSDRYFSRPNWSRHCGLPFVLLNVSKNFAGGTYPRTPAAVYYKHNTPSAFAQVKRPSQR